jgi:hypothetical protein
MTDRVDLVIAGDASASRTAAVGALQRGEHVLVVLRSADARAARRLRKGLLQAAGPATGHLRVITGAEVVCVDGIEQVEAVVVRHRATGRLLAVNASAFEAQDVDAAHP